MNAPLIPNCQLANCHRVARTEVDYRLHRGKVRRLRVCEFHEQKNARKLRRLNKLAALILIALPALAGCAGVSPFRGEAVNPDQGHEEPRFNIFSNRWEYAAPGDRLCFNIYEKTWTFCR